LAIRRCVTALFAVGSLAALYLSPAQAQLPPFPTPVDGELYYCPRIDVLSAKDGGPLTVTLDGKLDEQVWQWASFQPWVQGVNNLWGQAPVDDQDCSPLWALVADQDWLYMAFKIQDESIQSQSGSGCGSFNDDAVEIYFDGDNSEGPYGQDDFQLLISTPNIGTTDPDSLQVGVVRSGGCVYGGPADPTVFRGVVTELQADDGTSTGYQGEIAIALNSTTYGEWHVDSSNGNTIGWDVHIDDDDTGGGQDASTTSALIWSVRDKTSTAWNNTSVFGKLQFVSPLTVSRHIPSGLRNGQSGTVTITVTANPGPFSSGNVSVHEETPEGLTPSNPSNGGTVTGRKIDWSLGNVTSEVILSYTVNIDKDARDGDFPGTAALDGSPFKIGGDRSYTGSPINPLGFIKMWNHLGPLAWNYPAQANDHGSPGACDAMDANGNSQLELDWIVNDGETITEANVLPFPGMVVRPKYGGNGMVPGGTGARAAGLTLEPGDTGKVVQDRFPVWKAGVSPTDTIDHSSAQVHGFDADDHMTLSCVYVTNHTNSAIETQIGVASDDSVQVYLGSQSVGQDNICRGYGPANTELDFFPVSLPVGESRVLVKVMDGGGASGFRLRFQDPRDPLAPGLLPPDITLSLESVHNLTPLTVVRSLSKDTFATGEEVTVTLAITTTPGPATVTMIEELPATAIVSGISDGGVQTGNAIQWTLAAVTQKSISYKLVPPSCLASMTFGFSTGKIALNEVVVTGQGSLTHVPFIDQDLTPWLSSDIGATGGAAEVRGAHEVLVDALGAGIKQSRDEFHFISRPISGDGEISMRIDCMDDPAGTGQVGLMVRDTSDVFSAHAFFSMSSQAPVAGGVGTLKGIFRRKTLSTQISSLITISQKDVTTLPVYLKLTRTGTKLSFQRSADGVAYTEVATKDIGTGTTQIDLKNDLLIGIAATPGGAGSSRFTLSSVSGPPFPTPEPAPNAPRNLAAHAGDKKVDLSWDDPLPGGSFTGYSILRDGTKIADVAAAPRAYTDSGLTNSTSYCYVVEATRGGVKSPDSNQACASPAGGTTFRRGDVDASGSIELTDAVKLLGFLFLGGPKPECLDAADTDDNGATDISDAVSNLNYQFLGGPPPAAPGPTICGVDPNPDELGCDVGCR
jgi:hypothetical protein